MSELILLTAVSVYAFWVGHRVIGLWGVAFVTRAGHVAASAALGLGLTAYIVLFVGLAGYLTLPAVLFAGGVVAIVLSLPGFVGWLPTERLSPVENARRVQVEHARLGRNRSDASLIPDERAGARRSLSSGLKPALQAWTSRLRPALRRCLRPGFAPLFQGGLVAIAVLGTLTSAMAPPTAGDALCYHLEIPKRFVQLGEVCYLPLTDNSLFPFLMEMLYTLGLLFGSPVLAQLMHWFVGLLFALAVIELATPMLGASGGRWAATVALLVPGVTNQMTAPLNDLAVALFSTLMVIAWTKWSTAFEQRWLILAGVCGGLGLSAKLVTAAMILVLVVATIVVRARRSGMVHACKAGAVFVAAVGLLSGVWYARSWHHLGNPIYPYFNQAFALEPHTRSLLVTTRNPVTLLWRATMHPEDFGGRGVQFGAVFLAVLPGLACVPRRNPALRQLLLVSLGYGIVWFIFRQDLRFLLPVVPMLAVGTVWVLKTIRDLSWPAFVPVASCVAGLLLFQGMIVVKRARPCVAVACGGESREDYLRRHEPSYRVAEFVNTRLPSDSCLVSQDFRGLYFGPQFVREAAMRRRIPYRERGEQLVQFLAACGFTHVLLVNSHNPDSAVYDQSFVERLGPAAERLPVVLTSHFHGPNGDSRDYKLLELPRSSASHIRDIHTRNLKGSSH